MKSLIRVIFFCLYLVDTASLAWVLISTALIWIMIPGIGLFYSVMTKRKSALSLLWLSFMSMAVTSFQVCIFIYYFDFTGKFKVNTIVLVVFNWLFTEFQSEWITIYG